ncbi:predicted protein [Sclerotinia sclerotiorum 1980 UF-70]|uniref:Uncharacterized protein n=1 Tax=Sclerotinia sclerotiorum (strain ATCC 18683 / 1980 / Ss-1) TaxID=665079 RepID=A7EIR6_SCLS1|nr:predicted protein [Sclerotinia sclerotiorum 1980 UF-70]EDO02732.1 predicted protein [Sclerotinia sclerotiorum 1980 UF-70]
MVGGWAKTRGYTRYASGADSRLLGRSLVCLARHLEKSKSISKAFHAPQRHRQTVKSSWTMKHPGQSDPGATVLLIQNCEEEEEEKEDIAVIDG